MANDLFDRLILRDYEPTDFEAAVRLNEDASKSTRMGPETGDWATDITSVVEDISRNGGELKVGTFTDVLLVMGGYMMLSETIAEIRRMRVAPTLQGMGVGRRFLESLEELSIKNGARALVLGTTDGQVGAQHLYSGSGYIEVSRKAEDDGLVHIRYEKLVPTT